MNKKFLMILICFIFIGSAIALNINETFNQRQYNNLDFNNIDFNMSIKNSYIENNKLFVEFEYNTFEKDTDSNDYVVITNTGKIPYYVEYYKECRKTNSIEKCNDEIVSFIYNQIDLFKTREKNKLEAQKTEVLINEINAFDFKTLYVNYDNYQVNHAYKRGDLFVYKNELYEVIQSHTAQVAWLPNQVKSLYKIHVLQEEGEIREWVQPTGGHDAYAIGDKVLFKGKVYESLISANVWSPAAYPAGWKQV